MENKNIIIILVAVIIVLVAVLGVMFLQANDKEPSRLKISDETLGEGDALSINLNDLKNNTIPNEKVHITITNSKGKVALNKTVKTNSKGNVKLGLELGKGKYVVNVTFDGNKNYFADNLKQNLTIKEAVTETVGEESHSSSSGSSYNTEPVYDGHTVSYKDGVRGVYSPSGEFFVDPTQDPSYRTF